MRPYLTRTPGSVQKLYPERLWRLQSSDSIYLTFDDGPIPDVTPWVLDQLKAYSASATFFCIGANIDRHPDIFRRLIDEGHTIGNHTQDHLNGLKCANPEYLQNVSDCAQRIDKYSPLSTKLFRPPYGRIRSSQARSLRDAGYQLVMWDVLTGDFDTERSGSDCLADSVKNLRPGSIVVMHDSLKAESRLKVVLPGILEHCHQMGWKCQALS